MRLAGILGMALLLSCSRSPHEGYKLVGDDVHLRYIALGDGDRAPGDADSLLLRFRAARLGDEPGSLWSTERWYLTADIRSGALMPVLRRLHVGDSMSVIAPGSSWPWEALLRRDLPPPADTMIVRTELALLNLIAPDEQAAHRARFKRSDPEGFERSLIEAYAAQEPGTWTRWGTSDLHYRISGEATDTARWAYGTPLLLHWEGFGLADGRRLDDTKLNGGAFHWSYGTPDQVLKGIEVAVSLLRPGQEGEFIFPSRMAFGERGLPGSLEPGMPVRYRVRVEPEPVP